MTHLPSDFNGVGLCSAPAPIYEYDALPEHIQRQTADDYRRDWARAHGYLPDPTPAPAPVPEPPLTFACQRCGAVWHYRGPCPACNPQVEAHDA